MEIMDLAKEHRGRTKTQAAQETEDALELAQHKADRLEYLRVRAGMSMDALAKAMGFKGQSSIQRYLSPDYELGYRPELLARFKKAMVGRGNPPVTEKDFDLLIQYQHLHQLEAIQSAADSVAKATQEAARAQRAVLPLPEGTVTLDMPRQLSPKSIEFLKAWLELVASAIESKKEK